MKNNPWLIVPKPHGAKVVGCKWLYKLNDDIEKVEPMKYKAIFITQGDTQVERMDYNDIFSPMVKYTSIRLLLSMIVHFNMHLEHIDVKIRYEYKGKEDHMYMLSGVYMALSSHKGNGTKGFMVLPIT